MKIAIFGATGNMGREVVRQLLETRFATNLTLLVRSAKKEEQLRKSFSKYLTRLTFVHGDVSSFEAVEKVVHGSSYVIDMAALIPPRSDYDPKGALTANVVGPENIVKAIRQQGREPKLIHISTVAVYGDRTLKNPKGRVGDPVLPSVYDMYSLTKERGELAILESGLRNWVILRQTAMFSDNLIEDNLKDGLMFHTRLDDPLEWLSAKDSASLVVRLLDSDIQGKIRGIPFYRHVYDMAGGPQSRVCGWQVMALGLGMASLSFRDIFIPQDFVTRNFHGVWYGNNNYLNELFEYQHDTIFEYFEKLSKKHPFMKLAKLVPSSLIRYVLCQKWLGENENTPSLWYRKKKDMLLVAYFGSREKYEELPRTWEGIRLPLPTKEEPKGLEPLYDVDKPENEIDLQDLKELARLHGGTLLESVYEKGDIYRPLAFRDQDGNNFRMSAYTVYKAGHWNNPTLHGLVWDFDRLSRKDRIYAQYWYETHDPNENHFYDMDESFAYRLKENGK